MARWVSVKEAAEILGVSQDTVKRRLKAGELVSKQEPNPKGFKWLVEIESDAPAIEAATVDAPHAAALEIAVLTQKVESLERERDLMERYQENLWEELVSRRREVEQLHILLQRSLEPKQPMQLPPQKGSTATVSATAQLRQAIMTSWWWKKLFAPTPPAN